MEDVVIVEAKRTPIGAFSGSLATLTAPELGAAAIFDLIKQSGISPDYVEEVIMGNVLSAGTGQAPARQAALKAGLSDRTRSEEHTSELQSRGHLVCRLLLEKKSEHS